MLNFFSGSSKYIQRYKKLEIFNLDEPLFSNAEEVKDFRTLMNLSAGSVKKIRLVGLQLNSFGNLRFQIELRQHEKMGRVTLYATPNKNIMGDKDDHTLINHILNPQIVSHIQLLIGKIDLSPVINKMQENNLL